MKKGRYSKKEINFIKDNIGLGSNRIATELDRDPESVLDFIKRKVAKGDIEAPTWLENTVSSE